MMAERGLFLSGFSVRRAVRATDGKGGFTEAFSEVATPRGRLSPLSLAEAQVGQQLLGRVTHRFSTEASVDIRAGDRLVYNGRTLEVKAVSVTSSGLRKQCLVEETDNA